MMRRQKGFTLIELMIVVAILAILAVIAIPNFTAIIDRARESATKGTLGSLRDAVVQYYGMTEGHLPVHLNDRLYKYELGDGSFIVVSFLPGNGPVYDPRTDTELGETGQHEGFFPADPNDPTKPRAFTKFRRNVGKTDNTVVEVAVNGTLNTTVDTGGWIYFPGDQSAEISNINVKAQVVSADGQKIRTLNAGDICPNNGAIDSTGETYYIEY